MPTRIPRGTLPKGWRIGLPQSVIECVLLVERYSSRGLFITSDEDEKGYLWVRLCEGHPYANRHGWQRLHRYLMMRALRRRLHWYEHVHHEPEHDKATTNIRQLVLTEAVDHGKRHYAKRLSRGGRHLTTWKPREPNGRFTKIPRDGEVPF
jgi:hypothetical protein